MDPRGDTIGTCRTQSYGHPERLAIIETYYLGCSAIPEYKVPETKEVKKQQLATQHSLYVLDDFLPPATMSLLQLDKASSALMKKAGSQGVGLS